MTDKLTFPNYGGQALLEGVMMRGSQAVAIACRAPDQQIVVRIEKLGQLYHSRLTKIPFLRGLILLWDALGLGMRALAHSANVQGSEEERIEGPQLYATLGVTLVIFLVFFIGLPMGGGELLRAHLGIWLSVLIEGGVRLLIVIVYVALVGRIPEIGRVFAYHGAEHKTINAFEAGVELTPENVAPFSLEHPRCGTAFLLTVALLSVLLYFFLGPLDFIWRLLGRIVLIPVLATLAYEYIRWTAAHRDNPLVRWLIKPNLALQRLTTRQPTLEMLEVAITAFKAMRAEEQQPV
jgi:uncharacterized protein YqhQ